MEDRAIRAIDSAKDMGVETQIKPKVITSGNPKLNLLFCAQIFNHIPGLEPPTEKEKKEFAELVDQDSGDSREERQFRFWINSLDIEGIPQLENLYEGVGDGIVLLKVMDRL